MRTSLRSSALLVLLALPLAAQAPAGPCGRGVRLAPPPVPVGPQADLWETIAPDYTNVRGLNYVPLWAGNSVGAWRGYDQLQVEADLGYFRGIGCNTIRVWLSEAVYHEEGELFLAKLVDLLRRCEAHGVYVIPILWDAVGVQPSETPYEDLDTWVKNPSTADTEDPAFWAERGDDYVEAVVCAARGSRALLMWDVMNEPGAVPFVHHYAQLVDQIAPRDVVTIGWGAAHSNAQTAGWPEVDVLSYHPYGCFRQNVELWTRRAREISAANGGKPILATELASPGLAQRYEDALGHITREGVGFLLFQAMIGPPPHFNWWQDGFFYADGEVRDLPGVQAFQDVSVAQGYAGPLTPLVEKDPEDPLFLGMYPVPLGFGGPELVDAIYAWGERPPLEPEYVDTFELVATWASISIAWLEVLQPSDVQWLQSVIDAFDDAVDAGEYEEADFYLDLWGFFNLAYVDTLGLSG